MTTNGVTQTKFVKWLALSLLNNQAKIQYTKSCSGFPGTAFLFSSPKPYSPESQQNQINGSKNSSETR